LKGGMGLYLVALLLLGLSFVPANATDIVSMPHSLKPTYTLGRCVDGSSDGSVGFSSDGRWLACTEGFAKKQQLLLYSLQINSSERPHLEHTLNVSMRGFFAQATLAFAPNAKWLAVGQDGIKLYEIGLADPLLFRYTLNTSSVMSNVIFSADSKWLAAVSTKDSEVWLYKMVPAGAPQLTKKLKIGGRRQDITDLKIAFSPDGKWFASGTCYGGTDGSVWIHSLDSGNETRTLKGIGGENLAFSQDSKWLLAEIASGEVYVYAMDKSSNYSFSPFQENKNLDHIVLATAFAPDGKWLAVGVPSHRGDVATGEVRMFATAEVLGGSCPREPKPHCIMPSEADDFPTIAFSPDQKWMAVGTNYEGLAMYHGWESECAAELIVV